MIESDTPFVSFLTNLNLRRIFPQPETLLGFVAEFQAKEMIIILSIKLGNFH